MQKQTKKQLAILILSSEEEVSESIGQIAQASLKFQQIDAEANSKINDIKAGASDLIKPLEEKISRLFTAIQAYAKKHRDSLTEGGKIKTIELPTGKIVWRLTPPSVGLDCRELEVIASLESSGLNEFIRYVPEINREAILNNPEGVAFLKCIHITQNEIFEVIPAKVQISPAIQKKLRRTRRVK